MKARLVELVTRSADDGPDEPGSVAALCPNCHRRAHYAADADRFNTQIMSSPANVSNNRNINPSFIHTGNQLIRSGELSILLGVKNSETGITINIFIAVFLYPRRKYVGVKINNHRQIIAAWPEPLQPSRHLY